MAILTTFSPINNARFASTTILADDFRLIVSQKNPLARREKVNFKNWAGLPWISMYGQFIQRQVLNNYLLYCKMKPNFLYLTDDTELILNLVKQDVGISIVSTKMAEKTSGIKALKIEGVLPMKMYLTLTRQLDDALSDKQQAAEQAITHFAQTNKNIKKRIRLLSNPFSVCQANYYF